MHRSGAALALVRLDLFQKAAVQLDVLELLVAAEGQIHQLLEHACARKQVSGASGAGARERAGGAPWSSQLAARLLEGAGPGRWTSRRPFSSPATRNASTCTSCGVTASFILSVSTLGM